MQRELTTPINIIRRLAVVAAIVALPFLLSFFIRQWLGQVLWVQIPFHSAIEAGGGVAAIVLAALILSGRQDNRDTLYFFAFGLLAMGVLDTFHAFVEPGPAFVWLHSLATFLGGLLSALTWLGTAEMDRPRMLSWAWLIGVFCCVIGGFSLLFPQMIPPMVEHGRFTAMALTLNIAGGFLFLCAAVLFLIKSRDEGAGEMLVFCVLCASFGVAGVLFQMSSLWDVEWWAWHTVRLLAYIVALGYVGQAYRRAQLELLQKYDLEEMVSTLQQQKAAIETNNRNRDGGNRFHEALRGEQTVASLAEKGLEVIARHLDVRVATFYLVDQGAETGELYHLSSYAFTKPANPPQRFRLDQGLIGQAARTGEQVMVRDVPQHYLKISSGLGKGAPALICLTPVLHNQQLLGVMELGLLVELSESQNDFLLQCLPSLAIAIVAAQSRESLEVSLASSEQLADELLQKNEELQTQSEELQTQSEELQAQTEEMRAQSEELRAQSEELEQQQKGLDSRSEELQDANKEILL